MKISGYAIIFDKPDRVGDVIALSSISHLPESLPILWNGDRFYPIGRTSLLRPEPKGLYIEARIRPEVYPRHIEPEMLDGLAIGYLGKKASALPGGGRFLEAIDVLDVSLTLHPTHAETRFRVLEEA